jgi:hypothetical protein
VLLASEWSQYRLAYRKARHNLPWTCPRNSGTKLPWMVGLLAAVVGRPCSGQIHCKLRQAMLSTSAGSFAAHARIDLEGRRGSRMASMRETSLQFAGHTGLRYRRWEEWSAGQVQKAHRPRSPHRRSARWLGRPPCPARNPHPGNPRPGRGPNPTHSWWA